MGRVNRISAVLQTTFRETIRNKILLHMLGFAIVMFGLAWIIGSWSLGESEKIITDLGLTITSLAGVIIALFAGIVLVWGEVDRGTILPILAKPLPRWEFILGKFFGFTGSVLLVYFGMCLILLLQLFMLGRPCNAEFFWAIYLSGWEIVIIIALAVMFSSFTSPSLAALLSLILFVAGRFSWDIKVFLQYNPEVSSKPLLEAVYAVIPHLSYFNVRHAAVHALPIPWDQLLLSTAYGMIYCTIVLVIAMLYFHSRDLA